MVGNVPTQGGFGLGTAYGAVVIDPSGVYAGMREAKRAFDDGLASIGLGIRSLGDTISSVGSSLTILTAPLAAFGGAGIKVAADFDTLMRQIEVFGNVAPDDLERVRQKALQFGADTKFSANDAAAAMLDLLKSGQSLDETLASMPAVLDLAGAGNMNLAQSASIVTSSLAMFRLEATEANRVSNALARAANASNAEISDLGLAMTNVGPVAANYGISVEDTAAILAVFANNGLKGAEAGTQLKSMLLNLTRPTDKVKEAMETLGVSLYDNQGNVRDFNSFILDLDAALDQLPVEQQNELMQQLGGSYGIVGLSALRATGGIDSMRAAMAEAPDAASVASSFMDTFKGKVESLMGSIETLQISALTPFMNEVLAPMADRLIAIVNGITDWIQQNPELTKQIVTVLAAVTALGPSLFIVGKGISAIGSLISSFGSAVGFLLSPIGLVTAAVAGLAYVFINDVGGIRTALTPVIEEIGRKLQELWTQVQPVLQQLYDWFVTVALPAVLAFIRDVAIPAIDDFIQLLVGIWDAVRPALETLGNWFINDALPAVVDVVQNRVLPVLQDLVSFLGGLWESVRPALESVANWFLNEALPAILSFISDTAIPLIGDLIYWLQQIWEAVAPIIQGLVDWFINTGWPLIRDVIENVAIPVIESLIGWLQDIWEVVGPVIQGLLDWFQTNGWPIIEGIINLAVENVIKPLIEILKDIWEVVGPVIDGLVKWFTETGFPLIQAAVDAFVTNVLTPLINLLKGIWDAVKGPLESLRDGIGAIFNWLKDNIIQPIIDLIVSIPQKVQEAAGAIGDFLGEAVLGRNLSETEFMQTAVQNIVERQDSGGPGLAGMPYLIGPPQQGNELFVPSSNGTFVPDFAKMMEALVNGGGGGGDNITLNVPVEVLRDEPRLMQNARSFAEEFMAEKQRRGG